MEKLSILTADLLDIIFEYRNKLYGAYELRKTYPKRIAYAMGATFLLCLLFVGGTMLANGKKVARNFDSGPDIILKKIEEPPKQEPPPPPPKPVQPMVEQVIFTPPLIVNIDSIPEEEQLTPLEDLELKKIGGSVTHGDGDPDIIAPPVENVRVIVEAPKVDDNLPFTTVQVEARFPGDLAGWAKYLRSHLNSDLPSQNGAPAGKYTVVISFIVNKEGVISEVQALNDPGYGTKEEAIRVIQKGPHWIPAIQNGRNVIYRQKQAITFQVMEE